MQRTSERVVIRDGSVPPAAIARRVYRIGCAGGRCGRIAVSVKEAERADEPLQDYSGFGRVDAVHVLAQAGEPRDFEQVITRM